MSAWTETTDSNLARRRLYSKLFRVLCASLAWFGVVVLLILLVRVGARGIGWLSFDFLTNFPSRYPAKAGLKSALFGTVWLISMTSLIAIPLGVSAAVYLEEYAPKGRFSTFLEINISNLAGVPSIVFGLLGLTLFVRGLALGQSLLAGAMTMSLLILPVVVTVSREAIRAVPLSMRLAAYGLGATRWQTVRHHVLPAALPGIVTGVILALSRAIGETAPLIMMGALTYVAFVPEGPMDSFSVLPIQIYNWASRPQAEFHDLAAAGIIVLLSVLLVMNGIAVFIRYRSEKRLG